MGRQDFGADLVNAQLLCDHLCRRTVVAGEHLHPQMHGVEGLHLRTGVFLLHVRHGKHTKVFLLAAAKQQGLGRKLLRRDLHAVFLQEGRAAAEIFRSLQQAGDALAGNGLEPLRHGDRQAALFTFGHGGAGNGMLGILLHCADGFQKPLRVGAHHVGDEELSLGQGARFVHDHRVHMMEHLQRLRRTDQNAEFRAAPGADHNGHRSCQTQRAGAGDHQYGNSRRQRERQLSARQHPGGKGQQGNADDHGHEHPRHFVGQTGDGRLGAAGLLHQTDHLGQGRILAHLVGAEGQSAGLVHGGRRQSVARRLMDRQALSRQGAFVYVGLALQHRPVNGDPAAGAYLNPVAETHLGGGNLDPRTVPLHQCRLGRQVHQSGNGLAGLAFGFRFKVFSQGHQGQDHGSRLVIQISALLPQGKLHRDSEPVEQRRAGTDGDQRVHIGRAVEEGLHALGKIGAVDDDHRQRQSQLDQGHPHRSMKGMGQGQPQHMTHGKIHQDHQQRHGDIQPQAHFFQCFLLGSVLARGVFRQLLGAVAGLRDGGNDGFRCQPRLVIIDLHHSRQQIHIGTAHPLQFFRDALHPGRTRRAGHPCNAITFLHPPTSFQTILCFLWLFYTNYSTFPSFPQGMTCNFSCAPLSWGMG